MTDITSFCWTLERGSPILIKVVFHCAPGMAAALKRALPKAAHASARRRTRVRCGGRKWVGQFLKQEGADVQVVLSYMTGKGETLRKAADALWAWGGGVPDQGAGCHKPIL